MSRRAFRGSVAMPRPAAAWLMSLVASATLWITEQLPLWVIALQCLGYVVSFATRESPPAFRRNPIVLNIGMLGITTVTIRSALDGNPATISLACFTALAQALQLLDARPRRSEFLLVALALFQVILASNLTDSVLFPPLVILFLVSVTWTLLVHTLRMEAAEAGDPSAASRAMTRDLRRMTMLATSGCLVLALGLFLLLPRVKSHVLRSGIPGSLAVSGFSDQVRLGDAGPIRQDSSIVLRVESVEGTPAAPADAYWRGLAFDAFDGRSWSISARERSAARRQMNGIGRFGIRLQPTAQGDRIGQRILREPVEASVLFASGDIERIEGPFQHLERDANGGIYLPGQADDRVRYTVWSRATERNAMALKRDLARVPFEPAPGGPRPANRYLELPELDPGVAELAVEIVGDASSDFERAIRLQESLRLRGRYTDSPAALGDAATSPIEAFLLGALEGHCEYFASAMVILARTQGLPARLVNGFAGGSPNSLGDFVEVTRADAHAWVEIHFEKAGWVRFDPTPPDRRLRATAAPSLWTRMGQLGSAVELWWFQRVVDFDSADQIATMRGLWQGWRGATDSSAGEGPETDRSADRSPKEWIIEPIAPAALLALLGALLYFARRGVGRASPAIPIAYHRALRLLSRRGWTRDATTSARDFSSLLARELPPDAAAAFTRITDRYLAERFGQIEPGDLGAELATLEHAIDRMRLRNQPHVG